MGARSERHLSRELLDELPAADPSAVQSRADLRRVNAWMGNAAILARMLSRLRPDGPRGRLAEIGGGDGTLLLSIARRMPRAWAGVKVEVVDRQQLVSAETIGCFGKIGWDVQVSTADVHGWAQAKGDLDVLIANLFLHHFGDDELRTLFRHLSRRVSCFLACEPRRYRFTRLPALLLALI